MQETFPKRRPEWLVAALLLTAGCSEPRIPVSIPFEAAFKGNPIHCTSDGIALTDLRLFVSGVTAEMLDGRAVDIPLIVDANWHNGAVGLIDIEDGRGACDGGTIETNNTLNLHWPEDDVKALSLTIGVPFSENHADPLKAAAPLDDSAMHWHWRSGYKFLRAGVESETDGFWLHLGSTGCQGTTGNITGCSQPNRVTVKLDGFVAGQSAAVVHLDQLFHQVDLADGLPGDCSSGPLESSCEPVLSNLGLASTPARPWLTMERR